MAPGACLPQRELHPWEPPSLSGVTQYATLSTADGWEKITAGDQDSACGGLGGPGLVCVCVYMGWMGGLTFFFKGS